MKKASIQDYHLLIEYFTSARTHAVGTKYTLLELSKNTIDDFTDCINQENSLVMTNFEIDHYTKRLEILKKVFDFTMFIHDFSESEINRFKKEISSMAAKGDGETLN